MTTTPDTPITHKGLKVNNKMSYTVGVSRFFGFGWKVFRGVCRHEIETLGSAAHLVLTFQDGSVLTVPDIGRRSMKVYPDHVAEQSRVEQYKRDIETVSNVVAEQKVAQLVERQQQTLQQRQHMTAVNGMSQVPIPR